MTDWILPKVSFKNLQGNLLDKIFEISCKKLQEKKFARKMTDWILPKVSFKNLQGNLLDKIFEIF
jgi:hypothetical protein